MLCVLAAEAFSHASQRAVRRTTTVVVPPLGAEHGAAAVTLGVHRQGRNEPLLHPGGDVGERYATCGLSSRGRFPWYHSVVQNHIVASRRRGLGPIGLGHLAVGLICLGLVAGCGSSDSAAPAPSSTTAVVTTTTAPPTTTVAASAEAVYDIPSSRELRAGPGSVLYFDDSNNPSPFTASVITDASGDPTTLSFTLDSTETISQVNAGVQKQASGAGVAVLGAIVATPSSGLQAAGTVVKAQVFDATGTKVAEVTKKVEPKSNLRAVALYGDVVVVIVDVDTESSTRQQVAALDSSTSAVLWSRDIAQQGSVNGCGVNTKANTSGLNVTSLDASPTGNVVYGGDSQLTSADPKTGAVAWAAKLPRCYAGDLAPTGSGPVHLIQTNGVSAVSTADGHQLGAFSENMAVDQVQGLLAVGPPKPSTDVNGQTDGAPAMRVIDTKTDQVVLEVSKDQATALNGLTVLAAFDGRVWIETGSTVDVIDARTGKQDPLSPARTAPLQQFSALPAGMGKNWLLLDRSGAGYRLLWRTDGEFAYADVVNRSTTSTTGPATATPT